MNHYITLFKETSILKDAHINDDFVLKGGGTPPLLVVDHNFCDFTGAKTYLLSQGWKHIEGPFSMTVSEFSCGEFSRLTAVFFGPDEKFKRYVAWDLTYGRKASDMPSQKNK